MPSEPDRRPSLSLTRAGAPAAGAATSPFVPSPPPDPAAYAALAGMAALTLDGVLLYAVLLFLGALAVRSWVVVKREEME